MGLRLDVYVTIVCDSATGDWTPLGTNYTYDGAMKVAEEATDALELSLTTAPERMRDGAAEIIRSIRVVPGVLFLDAEDLK